MPIFEYRASTNHSCEHCRQGFDVLLRSEQAGPENCPKCESPVQRIVSAPNIGQSGPSLDAANIEKHGFTQYKKSGKGVYEKTAGKGPDVISDK